MIPSSKVLWGEGLFLRPQHFQRQDAYHEWRLAEMSRVVHPYFWGIRHGRIDTDALAAGVLRFNELQIVFPDGELFSAPQEDALPAPVSLDSIPAGTSEIVFHAVIAPMRANGSNFAATDAPGDGDRRYAQANHPAGDWFTGAAEAEVTSLRRVVRVVADTADRAHRVGVPLCRLRRSATGPFEVDARFVPPSTSLRAAPALGAMLRRLLDVLQAKVDALYGSHREPSKNVIEFRSGDVASFWLLHTASSAFAGLSHLHHHPALHPERLYERMLELAGALLTFSKTHSLADLPPYSHEAPGPCFATLDQIIANLLETVISTRYFSIALDEVRPSFYNGRLDSGSIGPATAFYLGVKAAVPASELIDAVPLRVKLGAPDDVDKFVLSATGGLKLSPVTQVPAAIPVRPGHSYFAVDTRGPLHERMLQARTMTLYVPAGLPDLRLELFALNP